MGRRSFYRLGLVIIALVVGLRGVDPLTGPTTVRTSAGHPSAAPVATPSVAGPPTPVTTLGTPCLDVASWPVTARLNQLLMVGGQFSDLAASGAEATAGVGGLWLSDQPPAGSRAAIQSGLAALVAEAKAAQRVVPWLATDEEGGSVARLADVIGPLPSPREMVARWSASQVRSALSAHGSAMTSLGITMDLAPVLDTASASNSPSNEVQRSFSEDPAQAATYGSAFVEGLSAAGVVPVVKHFPGLGHASADTDLATATDPPISQLEASDLIAFRRVADAGVPVVMVGHPIVPGLTGGLPASLSPATYALLRRGLGFTGVALTDSLVARAIPAAGYTQASAAVAALEAGADMVLIDARSWAPTVQALQEAVTAGGLSMAAVNASVLRILGAKGLLACS